MRNIVSDLLKTDLTLARGMTKPEKNDLYRMIASTELRTFAFLIRCVSPVAASPCSNSYSGSLLFLFLLLRHLLPSPQKLRLMFKTNVFSFCAMNHGTRQEKKCMKGTFCIQC